MSDDVPVFALRPGQAASVRDFANRWLTQQEITEALAVPWTADESRRLRAWLAWSTVLTLGLVAVLYALARWG